MKSDEEHHLTHQLSFGTIGTAAFRKSMAARSWVGLLRFENIKSYGLLEFLTKALPLIGVV